MSLLEGRQRDVQTGERVPFEEEEAQAAPPQRPGQRSVVTDVASIGAVSVIANGLIGTARAPDGQIPSAVGNASTAPAQRQAQQTKSKIMNEAAKEVQSGKPIKSSDLDRIGRFVSQLFPQGSLGNTLDQDDIFGLGISASGKRGGRNTVDTHEHFRVRREVRDLKKEAMRIRLRKQAEDMEEYRQMRNRELIEYNVKMQTLPLARAARS